MSALHRWRDSSDIVHAVQEWVTWSFCVIDRELEDSAEDMDDEDLRHAGRLTMETACGAQIPAEEEIYVSRTEKVSCLQCLSVDSK